MSARALTGIRCAFLLVLPGDSFATLSIVFNVDDQMASLLQGFDSNGASRWFVLLRSLLGGFETVVKGIAQKVQ